MEKKLRVFLNGNLGTGCLAPLTGTDWKALQAAVAIIDLYSYDRTPVVLRAFEAVVRRMQPKCHRFAYHAIAMILDWSDRAAVWAEAELPLVQNLGRCEFEPR